MDPFQRSRFTIHDLETSYDTLCGNQYPLDLPFEKIQERFFTSMYHHRRWDKTYHLLEKRPKQLTLAKLKANIKLTKKMVFPEFETYIVDPTMEIHLVSPRKLHHLGLPEEIELTDEQLFWLKHETTDIAI